VVANALLKINHRVRTGRYEREGNGTGAGESAGSPFHKIPLEIVSEPWCIGMAVPGSGLAHGHTDVYP